MTTDQMNRKLGRIGDRVSGLEAGHAVRGTNLRGAKDIAALGTVTKRCHSVPRSRQRCPASCKMDRSMRAISPRIAALCSPGPRVSAQTCITPLRLAPLD